MRLVPRPPLSPLFFGKSVACAARDVTVARMTYLSLSLGNDEEEEGEEERRRLTSRVARLW